MDTSTVVWLLADFGVLAYLVLILASGMPESSSVALRRLTSLILVSLYCVMRLAL